MIPQAFIAKWQDNTLTERASSHLNLSGSNSPQLAAGMLYQRFLSACLNARSKE